MPKITRNELTRMAERHGLALMREMGKYRFADPDPDNTGCFLRVHRTCHSLQEARVWFDGYLTGKLAVMDWGK